MTKDVENAIVLAWRDWHLGYQLEDIPGAPNPSFVRGFEYGVKFAENRKSPGCCCDNKKPLIGGAW